MSEPSPKLPLQQQIRQPKAMIALAIAGVLILNILLYLLSTSPQYKDKSDVSKELQALKQQHRVLTIMPLPDQVTSLKISELLEKVPTNQVEANVLAELLNFTVMEGNKITFFEEVIDKDSKDALEDKIKKLSDSAANDEDLNTTSNEEETTTQEVETSANSTNNDSIFTASHYKISVVGYLPHLINFFGLVSNHTAVTSIEEWGFVEVDEKEFEDDPDFAEKTGLYSLSLAFTLYSIPQYRDIFGPPPSKGTALEDILYELRQKYPGLYPGVYPIGEEAI